MNQYISYNNIDRKVNKWWKKLFFWGIEIAILNALVLWKLSRDDNYITEREFKEEIYRALLFHKTEVKKYNDNVSIIPYQYQRMIHYLENKKGIHKRCTLCQINGKRKEFNIYCKICKNKQGKPLYLCLKCLQEYHEKYVNKYDNKIK